MQSGAIGSGPRAGKSVLGSLARSSVGAKWMMGITGALFVGWLLLHLAGNLQVFAGAEKLNGYAALLSGEPMLLWGQRLFLLVVVFLHVAAGLRLAYLNRQARQDRYQAGYRFRRAGLASRLMPYTGVVLLAFILFHLAHFTFGWVPPVDKALMDGSGNPDVYTMMVSSFVLPGLVVIYVVGMALLALHLSHGLWSMVQTFGLNGERWTPFALQAGKLLAVLIALAFAAMPLAILAGMVSN